MKILFTKILISFLLIGSVVSAQSNHEKLINDYFLNNYKEIGIIKEDVSEWLITDQSYSKQSGVSHVYIQQQFKGIPLFNGLANFAIKEGKVYLVGNRLVANLKDLVKSNTPKLNASDAIVSAATVLNIASPQNLKVIKTLGANNFIFNTGGISKENIPVRLMYYSVSPEKIRLVWDVSIYTLDAKHWWSAQIDAETGKLIAKNDWVVQCNFDHAPLISCSATCGTMLAPSGKGAPNTVASPGQYTVFQLPIESPNHGTISTAVDPADTLSSPYGWHDTDGIVGHEYTITRGNNVFAYEDGDDDDLPGFSPDGGPALIFNFPYNGSSAPATYQEAAITNLFYMNNMIHDVWYQHGFDEVSGNFQVNNYGNGGLGADEVFAEAQDGGGTNNANFATPPDGTNPRMQMYLWNQAQQAGSYLEILSPVGIAGPYSSTDAAFGPALPAVPITADIVLIEDNTAPINDGCDPIVNGAQLAGKIVMIDRGSCAFTVKVEAAQSEGALAVIIVNNVAGAPIQVGGTSAIVTIPSIMISQADGNLIKAQLALGPVSGSISDGGGVSNERDGDLDNVIIAHEYGHGISTRLTGGPSNSNCLTNSEQMGEGWSDWFGLMMTIEPGDQAGDIRGVGTFATGEPTNGTGIRPAPYSTNFAINNFTYGASNNTGQISEPHGVGFIFATVLWDLTWALIDQYGGTPDPDLYNGTGGNNIAMKLIIEGLKLQPCNPGMIDGRDAILLADQMLYGGIHKCLIWNVFANRGFGFSASQGSSQSRSDQVEAFDIPSFCQTITAAPVAAFTASSFSSCVASISFTDSSLSIPQSWLWSFGDGTTSTLQNPTHTFTSNGVFNVQLVVTNTLGTDSITQQVTINLPPAPVTNDVQVCAGDTAFVNTVVTGVAQWKNTSNSIINMGSTLVVPNVTTPQTFYIENLIGGPIQYVGPVDASFGSGGFNASGFHGAVNFTADKGFEIASAWVNASGAGPRKIYLSSGSNTNGVPPSGAQIVDSITVNLVDGIQRVPLNLMVPDSGDYNLGTNNSNLYRNNSGASYPYALTNYMTIASSSSTTNPATYYYFFYDIEVRDPQCISSVDTVVVSPVITNFGFVVTGNAVAFSDSSVAATSWLWDFGDGNTSTLQNPNHVYGAIGTYQVTLSINGLPCSVIYSVNITTVGIADLARNGLQFSLYPNPAKEQTKLELNQKLQKPASLLIYSLEGKQVRSMMVPAGTKEVIISLDGMAPQLYMVVLRNEEGEIRQKLFLN
ncbi:MAG: T9SS-dependent M36 family metallopeptidase [Bacteroidia bacterium]